MQLLDPGSARRPEPTAALATLGSRKELPARVRTLLEGVLALAGGQLERSISLSLTECEQQLFKLAEKARSSNEQHGVFESLREVKRARADVAPRYLLYVESQLAKLGEPDRVAPVAEAARGYSELTLVDTRDLEENITLQEIAAKAEIRHSQPLYALGHRFGVLAGSPALDADVLPVGPQQLCACLRYATACIGVALDHRLLLYRQFDRMLMTELGVLYSSLNEYFADKRILRHLQVNLPRPRVPARGSETARRATPASGDAPAEATPANAPAGAAASYDADSARDSELFTTLRELLYGRRQSLPSSGTATAPTTSDYVASGDDLQSVLGALQNRPAAPMVLGGRVVQRSVAHLKQDLLNHLRPLTPDGKAPQLAGEDSDTIELVGMLFDFIAKDARSDSAAQSLLTKLQVPVLRVALRDKTFFTRRAHPARQMLNAIAETSQYWIDDGDEPDRALTEKMQLVVDRIGTEYDGKAELFDEMLTDLSRHMGMLARKAEVAERRHVDAAKGRERLDLARDRATGAVAERLAGRKVNRVVRALLEQAWTDVLALTILRQGEESDAYRRRIAVADRLISNADGAMSSDMRTDIEQGLVQVGFHGDEAASMVRQLFTTETGGDENPASRTEIALKLKTRARLGEETPPAPTPTAANAETSRHRALVPPLDADELQTLDRLKTLSFGTWFEFVQNQQGQTVRRKLSWFSTLTGRCLFVNQRGARTDERSMEQLARDITRGQARVATVERESLIDRAWHAIVGTLKQFAGKTPAPAA